MSWRAKLPVEIAGSRVEVALHASYDLGEGALFDSQAREYLHVNINGRTATRHNLETGVVRNYQLPTTVGTIVPRRGGGAVVALDGGPAALNYETGAITPLAPTFAQPATSRCNDGKCGPDGRLYFGTMPRDCRLPVGKVRGRVRVRESGAFDVGMRAAAHGQPPPIPTTRHVAVIRA